MCQTHRETFYIAASIVFATFVGLLFPKVAVAFGIGGELFLRALKMVVVPLVVASVMSGVLGLGDVRKLGRPGAVAVGYYLTTTLFAVLLGIFLVNLIQPGIGFEAAPPAEVNTGREAMGIGEIFRHLLLMLVPDNLFKAAVEMELLPLISFAILFAAILTTVGEKCEHLRGLIHELHNAFLAVVLALMKVAPVGIFCLVAARFGEAQLEGAFLETLLKMGQYVLTVLSGLAFHALVTLPLIGWLLTGRNPYRLMADMAEALLTALATASSSATLPLTLECAIDRARIQREAVEFVIPIGATINMDGTALYEAVAVIFIAQLLGIELSFMQQAVVAVTATLAAIGAAGIPEAGLVTMVIVLQAVGLPTEMIGVLLAVDWFLDRFRTAVNVWGDAIGALVVARFFSARDQNQRVAA